MTVKLLVTLQTNFVFKRIFVTWYLYKENAEINKGFLVLFTFLIIRM